MYFFYYLRMLTWSKIIDNCVKKKRFGVCFYTSSCLKPLILFIYFVFCYKRAEEIATLSKKHQKPWLKEVAF